MLVVSYADQLLVLAGQVKAVCLAFTPDKQKCSILIHCILFACLFQEQMDMKVLQFQNKKLVERIDQRKRAEEELHKRIEQLENRQRTDDAVLMIVNRYWNQVCKDQLMKLYNKNK